MKKKVKKLLKLLVALVLVTSLMGCEDNSSSIDTEGIKDPNLAISLGIIEGHIKAKLKKTPNVDFDVTWDENAQNKYVQVNFTVPGLTESVEKLSWRIENEDTWQEYIDFTNSQSKLYDEVLADNGLLLYHSIVTIRYEGKEDYYIIVSVNGHTEINYWDYF